jgi:CRISPR-associated protein Cmr1
LNRVYEGEVITPMFSAGANPNQAELRATSLKGVLRFWWRTLNGQLPIQVLHEEEAKLFGSAGQGQGKLRIKVIDNQLKASKEPFPKPPTQDESKREAFTINILDYLAYGTQKAKKFIKEYLEPGQFQVRLSYPPEIESAINNSLYMLSNFGGLGARSRNGYGSLSFNSPNFSMPPAEFLKSLSLPQGKMQYTALSQGLKLFRTRKLHDSWDGALAELGVAYRNARLSLEPKHEFNKRKFVALPLADKMAHRRAKPYFMHVSRVDGKYEGRILFLPASFCAGLELDKNTLHYMDLEFAEVCSMMNEHLSKTLEVVL